MKIKSNVSDIELSELMAEHILKWPKNPLPEDIPQCPQCNASVLCQKCLFGLGADCPRYEIRRMWERHQAIGIWGFDEKEERKIIPDFAINLSSAMSLLKDIDSTIMYYDDMSAGMGVERPKYWQIHIKRKGNFGEDCSYRYLGCGIDKSFQRAICLAVLAANGFEIEQIW